MLLAGHLGRRWAVTVAAVVEEVTVEVTEEVTKVVTEEVTPHLLLTRRV